MEDESYGIISYRDFARVKKDIDELKSKNNVDTAKPLADSITKLSQNIDNMLQLFKNAAEEIKYEDSNQNHLSKDTGELSAKIEQILKQTKTIAEGMMAIADMVKELKSEREEKPEPPIINQQPMQQPPMMNQQRPTLMPNFQPQFYQPQPPIQPIGQEPQFVGDDFGSPLEPLPPIPDKKRGLFGKFKR
ncbi:MAG: hypothetical protein AABY14_04045 [Nanoarchaeota archaeon]